LGSRRRVYLEITSPNSSIISAFGHPVSVIKLYETFNISVLTGFVDFIAQFENKESVLFLPLVVRNETESPLKSFTITLNAACSV
jgi:hypothetical protein